MASITCLSCAKFMRDQNIYLYGQFHCVEIQLNYYKYHLHSYENPTLSYFCFRQDIFGLAGCWWNLVTETNLFNYGLKLYSNTTLTCDENFSRQVQNIISNSGHSIRGLMLFPFEWLHTFKVCCVCNSQC